MTDASCRCQSPDQRLSTNMRMTSRCRGGSSRTGSELVAGISPFAWLCEALNRYLVGAAAWISAERYHESSRLPDQRVRARRQPPDQEV